MKSNVKYNKKFNHLKTLIVDHCPCSSVAKRVRDNVWLLKGEVTYVLDFSQAGAVEGGVAQPRRLCDDPSPDGVFVAAVDGEVGRSQARGS